MPDPARALRSLLAVVAGAALQACGSPAAAPVPVLSVDSAGVTIVSNVDPTWNAGTAWTVPAEPIRTIGVLDGDERYQFFEISSAARQSDGDIVVADIGSRTVRLYGRDGTFTRTVGGPGSGPGEFQAPTQVMVQAGDSIAVWDNALFRLTKFDSNGDLAEVRAVRREDLAQSVAPPLYPGAALLLYNDELWVRIIEKAAVKGTAKGATVTAGKGATGPREAGAWFRQRSGALRVSPDNSGIDTVMFFADVQQVMLDAPWGQTAVIPPFAVNTTLAVQPNAARACIGDQARAEVSCFDEDGSRTVVRWPPRSAVLQENDDEIAAWREATAEQYALKMARDEARRFIATIPLPPERPQYSQILLDRAGHLWVRRGPVRDGGSTAVEYLVFSPPGEFLGAVSLPPIHVLEIGTNHVLGVYQDELEVEYLQVFEIVKPGVGPEPAS